MDEALPPRRSPVVQFMVPLLVMVADVKLFADPDISKIADEPMSRLKFEMLPPNHWESVPLPRIVSDPLPVSSPPARRSPPTSSVPFTVTVPELMAAVSLELGTASNDQPPGLSHNVFPWFSVSGAPTPSKTEQEAAREMAKNVKFLIHGGGNFVVTA